MEAAQLDKNDILEKAKALIRHYEAGNEEQASNILESISKMHERSLFSELGRLTRELHNAINGFHLDVRLADIAEQEIPDAKARLNYVIDMTDKSAHKVLTLVEDSLPLADEICHTAKKLQQLWKRFMNKDMNVNEFRQVADQLKIFFMQVETHSIDIKKNLTEVVMAQDFQDLTGQVIRRVISLVQDVENNLVNLIRLSGVHSGAKTGPSEIEAEGPNVPDVDDQKIRVAGQDEVDNLLSSLGF